MITKVYAHILDRDRNINAQKFDNAFYTKKTDLRDVRLPEEITSVIDIGTLVAELTKWPELLGALSQLVAAQASLSNVSY